MAKLEKTVGRRLLIPTESVPFLSTNPKPRYRLAIRPLEELLPRSHRLIWTARDEALAEAAGPHPHLDLSAN
jgi:hypothetical protein